jgi:predicted secreted hydrolase
VRSADFAFDLRASTPLPPLLQGEAGFSRKASTAGSASYYYSRPQLTVQGTVDVAGQRRAVRGRAWLDHEWASSLLPAAAVGWDWLGLNLDDGGALMAFRLRDRLGAPLWAAATRWHADGTVDRPAPAAVTFAPRRQWRSPRSGVSYPVQLEVRVGAERFALEPLLDDQELDARRSLGALYWEGAVQAFRDGRAVGRGYLELTGYGQRLRY